jgi:hypothetical protein
MMETRAELPFTGTTSVYLGCNQAYAHLLQVGSAVGKPPIQVPLGLR